MDFQWIATKPTQDQPDEPEWMRMRALSDCGQVFVPAIMSGMAEKEALSSAKSDGVVCVALKEHIYLPIDWVAKKNPLNPDVFDIIEASVHRTLGTMH